MKNLGIIIIFVVSGWLYGCSGGVHISARSSAYPGFYDTYYPINPSFHGPAYSPYYLNRHYDIHQRYHHHPLDRHHGVHDYDHWVNGRLHYYRHHVY